MADLAPFSRPTCRKVMPVLAAMHDGFAAHVDLQVIGQTAEGNPRLIRDVRPPFAVLDASALRVSYAADVETGPTLLLVDAEGRTEGQGVGFVRNDWQALVGDLLDRFGVEACRRSAQSESVLPNPGLGGNALPPL